MNAAENVTELLAWNAWANRQVFETLQRSGGEPSPALAAFQHVLETEITWLRRVGGSPGASVPLWGPVSPGQCGAWIEEAAASARALAAGLSPEVLESACTYRNSSGKEFTDALGVVLHHMLMHSSQYRGEAAAFLNAAGHRVPDLDYIFWRRLGKPD